MNYWFAMKFWDEKLPESRQSFRCASCYSLEPWTSAWRFQAMLGTSHRSCKRVRLLRSQSMLSVQLISHLLILPFFLYRWSADLFDFFLYFQLFFDWLSIVWFKVFVSFLNGLRYKTKNVNTKTDKFNAFLNPRRYQLFSRMSFIRIASRLQYLCEWEMEKIN